MPEVAGSLAGHGSCVFFAGTASSAANGLSPPIARENPPSLLSNAESGSSAGIYEDCTQAAEKLHLLHGFGPSIRTREPLKWRAARCPEPFEAILGPDLKEVGARPVVIPNSFCYTIWATQLRAIFLSYPL
jgi:hypothetical protein